VTAGQIKSGQKIWNNRVRRTRPDRGTGCHSCRSPGLCCRN
jgi:hypothetical protein